MATVSLDIMHTPELTGYVNDQGNTYTVNGLGVQVIAAVSGPTRRGFLGYDISQIPSNAISINALTLNWSVDASQAANCGVRFCDCAVNVADSTGSAIYNAIDGDPAFYSLSWTSFVTAPTGASSGTITLPTAAKMSLLDAVNTSRPWAIGVVALSGLVTLSNISPNFKLGVTYSVTDEAMDTCCTLAQVKERLDITDTNHDSMLNGIIMGVTDLFDTYCGRSLLQTTSDVTETYCGGTPFICLSRYPIISVTSVKESESWAFSSATALTVDTDYRIRSEYGQLYRTGAPINDYTRSSSVWARGIDSIQVVYRGGYCPPSREAGAGETPLPRDIVDAAIQQTTYIYKNRLTIGNQSQSVGGSNAVTPVPGSVLMSGYSLLPSVEATLRKYRNRGA